MKLTDPYYARFHGDPKDVVWFVGVWGFLDGEVGWKRLGRVCESVLDLISSYNAPRISYSRFLSQGNEEEVPSRKLDEGQMASIIDEVKKGNILSLHARTTPGDWKSMEKGHWFYLHLGSEFDDERMPLPEVKMKATFPLSGFNTEDSAKGYELLRDFLFTIGKAVPILYMYCNLGRDDIYPGVHGIDKIYAQTARHIPISQFDDIFRTRVDHYRSRVKGAFWLNILNPSHVEALGGVESIETEARPYLIQEFPHDRVMIQVTPSPIVGDTPENREAFTRLRRLLKPITGFAKEPRILRELGEAFEKKFLGRSD